VSDKQKRTILPVIVTDRVVDAERSVREWELSANPLICKSLPVGFDGCARPIYVIADRPQHLASLMSFGVALAYKATVQPGDFSLGLEEEAGRMAREAGAKRGEAYTKIVEEQRRGVLEKELADHLLCQLEMNASHCKAFSTNWIYGSLLYAPLALTPLLPFKREIKNLFFGKNTYPKKALDATDEKRARVFYKAICSQMDRTPEDRPEDSRAVRPLTEKLLRAVLPEMLPGLSRSLVINCADIDPVSRAPKRDIKGRGHFSHEQTQRSFGTVPITSFCT